MCILYIYIFTYSQYIYVRMFVLHWVGLEVSGVWYCFDGVWCISAISIVPNAGGSRRELDSWFMVKLPGVDFHWLYGLTDGKTTATSYAIRMVGGLPGGKPMGMFLSSVRVSSWSAMLMVGWVLVGFVPGNHVTEIGSAGKRYLGVRCFCGAPVPSAAAGWWPAGWGASPSSTQIVMKQRKIRHEAFLL